MRPDTELSAEATVVLAHCTEQPTDLTIDLLAETVGVGARQLSGPVDELVAAGRAVVNNGTVQIGPGSVATTRPLAAVDSADVEADDRHAWRVSQLIKDHHQDQTSMVPLHGPEATYAHIEALYQTAPKECLSVTPHMQASTLTELVGYLADDRRGMMAMLATGTQNIWVADQQLTRSRPMTDHMNVLAQHGEQIHIAPRISQRMFIFDRQIAFVPLDPHRHSLGAMMIRSSEVANALVGLFHELLARGTRFTPTAPHPLVHKDVLVLMAQGAKDETIARKLGISARTVRRSVADMMELSGADSRFQLAIAAVRTGWLDPDDLAVASQQSGPRETPVGGTA